MANRDTYKYYLKDGNKIIYAGITNDLERREREHQNDSQHKNTKIKKQGNCTTRKGGLEWEQEQRRKGIPTGH